MFALVSAWNFHIGASLTKRTKRILFFILTVVRMKWPLCQLSEFVHFSILIYLSPVPAQFDLGVLTKWPNSCLSVLQTAACVTAPSDFMRHWEFSIDPVAL